VLAKLHDNLSKNHTYSRCEIRRTLEHPYNQVEYHKMPSNARAESRLSRTSCHEVLHKAFLDARENMHLASKTEGMVEFMLGERVKARKKAYTAFTNSFQATKERDLSFSLFKDLSDAGAGLHKQDALLKEAEAKLEAAKQKSAVKSASFEEAKNNCERAECPQFRGARDEIPVTSKDEEMARKASREEQGRMWYQEAQAKAAEEERTNATGKEEEKRKAEKWKRQREVYERIQAAKKRQRDEYARQNPYSQSQKGSKPWSKDSDERPSKRSYQDAPPSEEPRNKKPRPTPQVTSTPVRLVARPSAAKHQEWISIVKAAFKDYTGLSSFPAPPANACSKPSCNDETRALAACACDIRKALNHLTASQLKDLRVLFHPDKFSKCREDLVESFKRKANAVFVVVNAMYGERK
jgi:hypothetical protein